jgi:hypothetical protein
MLVISSGEFRDKQKTYLDKVDEGIEILIRRGKYKSYKVIPVSESEDDTLMSKKDFFAKLDHSLQQAKEGKTTRVRGIDELNRFLENL